MSASCSSTLLSMDRSKKDLAVISGIIRTSCESEPVQVTFFHLEVRLYTLNYINRRCTKIREEIQCIN